MHDALNESVSRVRVLCFAEIGSTYMECVWGIIRMFCASEGLHYFVLKV